MAQLENSRKRVAELLVETGQAHHRAFQATDGADPDWPIWYAEYLHQPLSGLLQNDLTRSQLVYCLMSAEFERAARDEKAEWAPYYADHLLERFAPTPSLRQDKLALYYFPRCPFCRLVLAAIDKLGLEVELRDIRDDSKHWDDLVEARGRATVPVLKLESPDGGERWMPESADIVRYLMQSYG